MGAVVPGCDAGGLCRAAVHERRPFGVANAIWRQRRPFRTGAYLIEAARSPDIAVSCGPQLDQSWLPLVGSRSDRCGRPATGNAHKDAVAAVGLVSAPRSAPPTKKELRHRPITRRRTSERPRLYMGASARPATALITRCIADRRRAIAVPEIPRVRAANYGSTEPAKCGRPNLCAHLVGRWCATFDGASSAVQTAMP